MDTTPTLLELVRDLTDDEVAELQRLLAARTRRTTRAVPPMSRRTKTP